MNQTTHFIETLEERAVPAAITATLSGSTLNIVGDADNNDFTITGDAVDPMMFTLSSATDTINGGPSAMFEGVKNISIKLLDGNDKVSFSNVVPIHLLGSLKFDGGNGDNEVYAAEVTIDKGVSIKNGEGYDYADFMDSTINGNVSVKNGDGGSSFYFSRNSAGIASINGDLKITNGAGQDIVYLADTNVAGNIAVKNGASDGATAGYFQIYNNHNTTRSFVGGNISVSYKDGSVSNDGIWDYEILGNVSFSHGSGPAELYMDGYTTTLPVAIHGNLSVKGTGNTLLSIGQQYNNTGLILGGNLNVTSGPELANVQLDFLNVAGATKLKLGNGNNTVDINDSTFSGAVSVTLGSGANTLLIDAMAASILPTQFAGPVKIKAGNGGNSMTFAGMADDQQRIILLNTFVVDPGDGVNTINYYPTKVYGPFGNSIQFPS